MFNKMIKYNIFDNCLLFRFSHNLIFFSLKHIIYTFRNFDKSLQVYLKDLHSLHFVINFFKKSSFLRYCQLVEYTALHDLNAKSFTLCIELLSLNLCSRVSLKYTIFEHESPLSLIPYFLSSSWSEREMYDMFGIFFLNHNDLRRILTDYGFYGFPLRKDFPLIGYNEIHYSDSSKTIVSSLVNFKNKVK